MVFSSLIFLFRFLPLFFLGYYLAPGRYKNAVLLAASVFFYSWGEPRFLLVIFASVLVDYFASRGIAASGENKARRRFFLGCSLIFNIGALLFFKYMDFFIANINAVTGLSLPFLRLTLPLGISFYTFQTLSYTIDVYRGKVAAEHNFVDFAAFVTMFPQLIAGPIVTYLDIAKELKKRAVTAADAAQGLRLFILGLGKKVLLANNIGLLWEDVSALDPASLSAPLAWLGALAFGLQIYFDFSGYSLMAIGLGRMLGFSFPQNFNYPYLSRSISEFWRRWHMTLGSWFREYVYIPLGGNRKGRGRTLLNLLAVWFLTGFWHGASYNFILWGLMFFTLILLEKNGLGGFLERHRIFSHLYTLFFVAVSWVIFALTDFSAMGAYLGRMFSFCGGADWIYPLLNYGVLLLLCVVCSTGLMARAHCWLQKRPGLWNALLVVLLLLSVAYLVDDTFNPFLYFRF